MIKERIAKLIDLKSIITLLMTIFLGVLLFSEKKVNESVLALYCTSYGAIITYFFTKKKDGE